MLEAIMCKHSIMSELPEIVCCFRDKTCNVEDAFGGALCKRCMLHINGLYPFWGSVSSEADKAHRVPFRLKYPENNGRREGVGSWCIHQTVVYQNFGETTKTSIWLLLDPRIDAVAENRLRLLMNTQDSLFTFEKEPPLLGVVVLSAYFTNWQVGYGKIYEPRSLYQA